MKRIKKLSVNLINQIAAGEVIERPASVVKELVENSIDAKADKIEISVSNECRDIRIADNGLGIHPDDVELAFIKHATSKLDDEESLFHITSLGFRGEALASIISVAKLTCTTRTKDFEYGTKVESQNSVINKSQTGCAIGTIMEVKDLFFNQPARLKFLKSAKTEFSYIQEYIQSLAIAHPDISFVLKNNESTVISTTKSSDLLTRITEIYSTDIIDNLNEVKKIDNLSEIMITGYASIPSYTKSSKKSIHIFVNSRVVKCPVILKAIDMSYKNMLPIGRYPFVVINIDINPEDIDVNAHPTKREIRYKNPNQIFNFVQSAISSALTSVAHTQNANKYEFCKNDFGQADVNNDDNDWFKPTVTTLTKPFPVLSSVQNVIQNNIKFDSNSMADDIKQINIIGQYDNTYILIENEDNLEIVDQHIADERYIYEKLKSEKQISSQLLIISQPIDISPSEVELLENAKIPLEKFGYKIEKISDTQVIFKKIPQMLSSIKPEDILSELLNNLKNQEESDVELDTIEERIIVTTSCKAAVKAGEKLNMWQMEDLIKKLRTTKNPYTCPHGRPISHFISHKDIAAFFLRNN